LSLDSDVRRLAATRPFNVLPREALQLLAFSCEKRALKAERPLFAVGDAADCAFFVLDGEIQLTAESGERRVGPGVLIGETALLADTVRAADARACRDSTVLRIPRETFRRILTEFPDAAAKVQEGAAARARALLAELEAVRRRAFNP
jgi:CRP-like cAMP-binding protein